MAERRTQRGAAAVEAALVICFIVIPLTFAMISYGYMFSFRQSMSQAAAEGARAAAVAPAGVDHDEAETVAEKAIDEAFGGLAGGLSCGENNLTCSFTWDTSSTCGSDAAGNEMTCLTVRVSYPYSEHPLLPSIPGLGLLPDNLSYAATAQVS